MTELPTLTRQEISLTTGMPDGTEFEHSSFEDWTLTCSPRWDWYEYCYRPVAPERWKHTGRFEIPKRGEHVLDWVTGKAWHCKYDSSFKNRHWILGPDTPEKEPEEPEEMAYEIFPPQTGKYYHILVHRMLNPNDEFSMWELPGLEIDGRVFDRYSWPNHSPLGFSKHIFHAREGKLPTHAIFCRPDKED